MNIKGIRNYFDDNKIISIYINQEDTSKFAAGRIIAMNEEEILLGNIAPTGMYDGFSVIKTDFIYRISQNSKYEQRLDKLFNHYKSQYKNIKLESTNDNLVDALLKYALKNNYAIMIQQLESNENDIQGFVSEIQDDKVIINQIDKYGSNDGTTIIYKEDIKFIQCDSEEEQILKILSK